MEVGGTGLEVPGIEPGSGKVTTTAFYTFIPPFGTAHQSSSDRRDIDRLSPHFLIDNTEALTADEPERNYTLRVLRTYPPQSDLALVAAGHANLGSNCHSIIIIVCIYIVSVFLRGQRSPRRAY